MKRYIGLAAFAFAILACTAVWFGGLNQDEGWYLYAANLVSEGHVPYRDFFFTQGPVMPIVYSAFTWVWKGWGLLGARIFTLFLGVFGILFAAGLVRRLVPDERRNLASTVVVLLLGCNLYHLYYLAIPKTYALAGLFVLAAFYLLSFEHAALTFAAGLCLAFAAGTRISLGLLLAVAGVWLIVKGPRFAWLWFGIGGVLGLALAYGPYLLDPEALPGLFAAELYHSAREGFDPLMMVGSVSRFVRWYWPVLVLLGLGIGGVREGGLARLLLFSFASVFFVQTLAPHPYEDYHVPVVALLAVPAAAWASGLKIEGRASFVALLALGMTWAASFGSPLIEQWSTNAQDRFWTRKKLTSELGQLRQVAHDIESIDPGGSELFTQDLYLAIETRRKVPIQMSMGPFCYWGDGLPYRGAEKVVLDDAGMVSLIEQAPCEVAALSGYSFAIDVPSGRETPMDTQITFWTLVKRRYNLVFTESDFGQHATPLLVLKKKHGFDDR